MSTATPTPVQHTTVPSYVPATLGGSPTLPSPTSSSPTVGTQQQSPGPLPTTGTNWGLIVWIGVVVLVVGIVVVMWNRYNRSH